MAVTVGRIEYIVGADGRVLQKESRDSARKAGLTGGKQYSDSFTESFRKRWGGASGFKATLGKYDQNVIKQFQKLGGFTSKAYATRFEKTLVPAYQETGKKMQAWFEKLTLGRKDFDLKRMFKNSDDVQRDLARTLDLIDEMDASHQLGIFSGFKESIHDVRMLGKQIEKVMEDENWEFLTKQQMEYRDSIAQTSKAQAENEAKNRARFNANRKMLDEEGDHWVEIEQFVQGVNKALDAGVGIADDRGRVTDIQGLTKAARENVEIENERIANDIKANRLKMQRHMLAGQQLDDEEELVASARLGTEIARDQAKQEAHAARQREVAVRETMRLTGSKVKLADAEQDIVDALKRDIKFSSDGIDQMVTTRYLLEQNVDLEEDLIAVREKAARKQEKAHKKELLGLQQRLAFLKLNNQQAVDNRASARASIERMRTALSEAKIADEVAEKQQKRIQTQLEEITRGRDLMELKKKEMKQAKVYLDQLEDLESVREDAAHAMENTNHKIAQAEQRVDKHTKALERNANTTKIILAIRKDVYDEMLQTEGLRESTEAAIRNETAAIKDETVARVEAGDAAEESAKKVKKASKASEKAAKESVEKTKKTLKKGTKDFSDAADAKVKKSKQTLKTLEEHDEEFRKSQEAIQKSGIAPKLGVGPDPKWKQQAAEAERIVREQLKSEGSLGDQIEETTQKTKKKAKAQAELGEVIEETTKKTKKHAQAEIELGDATEKTVQKTKKKAKAQLEAAEATAAEETHLGKLLAKAKQEAGVTEERTKKVKKHTEAVNENTEAIEKGKKKLKESIEGLDESVKLNEKSVKSEKKLTEAQRKSADQREVNKEKAREYYRVLAQINDMVANERVWKKLIANLGGVGRATDAVRQKIKELGNTDYGNSLPTKVGELNRKLDDLVDKTNNVKNANDNLHGSQEKTSKGFKDNERDTDAFNRAMADLDRMMGSQKAWDRLVRQLGGVDNALRRVNERMRDASDNSGPNFDRQLAGLERRLADYVETSTKAAQKTKKLSDETKDSTKANEDHDKSWLKVGNSIRSSNSAFKDADKDTRVLGGAMDFLGDKLKNVGKSSDMNARAIVALVAALGEPIAVLGASLGPALVAVGGAAAGAVVGVGALVAVFKTLQTPVEKLPVSLRGVASEFQALGKSLGNLKLSIASAAFAEMGDTFPRMQSTVEALTPALQLMGTTVGKLGDQFSKALAPGTEGFSDLNTLILNSADIFETIVRIVGRFAGSFVKAMNQVLPLTQGFLKWVEDMSRDFEDFVSGPGGGFQDWVRHSMDIMRPLGDLLSALGRAMNNLVTDESVARTANFIEQLVKFVPHLENIIHFFGELDILGIVAELLVSVGDAFANVHEPMDALASAIRDALGPMIAAFGDVLSIGVTALNAIIVPLGAFIDILPPPLLYAIAAALTAIAVAFALFKVYTVIMKATAAVKLFMVSMTYWGKYGGAINKTILGTKAALSGLGGVALMGLVVALGALNKVIEEGTPKQEELRESLRKTGDAVKTFEDAFKRTGGVEEFFVGDISKSLEDLGYLLDKTKKAGNEFFDLSFNEQAAISSVRNFGQALGDLANTDLPGATKGFLELSKKYDLTAEQSETLLGEMGPLKEALESSANAAFGSAEGVDLLAYAEALATGTTDQLTAAQKGMTPEMEQAALMTELSAKALELLKGKSIEALDAVEGVSAGIKTLGSSFRSQQSAISSYEAAVDGVSESLSENGRAWALSEEAGRSNQAAIMDLAESTLNLASENYALTGSAEEAAAAIQAGRDEVIKSVEGMDLGGLTAEEYADKLGLIPGDVETLITANTSAGMEMADAFATRLFELGLIEVDPVVTLNAAEAEAAAAEIQRQLDGLTFNPFTARIDANGDGVDDAVSIAEGKVYDFASGEYVAKITAGTEGIDAAVTESKTALEGVAGGTYSAKIEADNNPAMAAVDAAEKGLDGLDKTTVVPTIDADNAKATAKTDSTEADLKALDKSTFKPKIDADPKLAIDKIRTTKEALKALEDTTYTVKLKVDNSQAMTKISDTQWAIDNMRGKTVNVNVKTNYSTSGVKPPEAARGMVLHGAQMVIGGEAGPEALVPLARPLSQVDPSVRWLSAIAQGYRRPPGSAEQGSPGNSKTVNIAPGAIVIEGDRAPETTATTVVNRIAERIGG